MLSITIAKDVSVTTPIVAFDEILKTKGAAATVLKTLWLLNHMQSY